MKDGFYWFKYYNEERKDIIYIEKDGEIFFFGNEINHTMEELKEFGEIIEEVKPCSI